MAVLLPKVFIGDALEQNKFWQEVKFEYTRLLLVAGWRKYVFVKCFSSEKKI